MSRLSEVRQSTYTKPHLRLLEILAANHIPIIHTEYRILRPGEFTADGIAKSYQADIVLEHNLIVEVEGEGTGSRDPHREVTLWKLGYNVLHVRNSEVEKPWTLFRIKLAVKTLGEAENLSSKWFLLDEQTDADKTLRAVARCREQVDMLIVAGIEPERLKRMLFQDYEKEIGGAHGNGEKR